MAVLTGPQAADLVNKLEKLKGIVVGYGNDGSVIPAVPKTAAQQLVTDIDTYFTTYFS